LEFDEDDFAAVNGDPVIVAVNVATVFDFSGFVWLFFFFFFCSRTTDLEESFRSVDKSLDNNKPFRPLQ
jgi:hypothetical protein